MTNPTQPTPEQLARWHEDADTAYARDLDVHISSPSREAYTAGYIFAKQENEQAIKDARKLALEEAMKLAEDHRLDLDASEYHRGWRNASVRMSNLIQELLK